MISFRNEICDSEEITMGKEERNISCNSIVIITQRRGKNFNGSLITDIGKWGFYCIVGRSGIS